MGQNLEVAYPVLLLTHLEGHDDVPRDGDAGGQGDAAVWCQPNSAARGRGLRASHRLAFPGISASSRPSPGSAWVWGWLGDAVAAPLHPSIPPALNLESLGVLRATGGSMRRLPHCVHPLPWWHWGHP